MMAPKGTAFYAISSPADESNYYSILTDAMDDENKPIFKVIKPKRICDNCLKKEMGLRVKCEHLKRVETWKDPETQKKLKCLYKTDPATALRELSGQICSSHNYCFDKNDIKALFDGFEVEDLQTHIKRRIRLEMITSSSPKYIYISVDPNGGGPSELAICSAYFTFTGKFVVKKKKIIIIYFSFFFLINLIFLHYFSYKIINVLS